MKQRLCVKFLTFLLTVQMVALSGLSAQLSADETEMEISLEQSALVQEGIVILDEDDLVDLPGMQEEENIVISDETGAEESMVIPDEAEAEEETEAETEPLFVEETEPLLYASSVLEEARNGIPLVVIRVDEEELYQSEKGNWYGSIADMNESVNHDVRCKGSVEILLPEENYTSEYGGGVPEGEIELDYIRGRGNSTWRNHEKKPYKIQLKEKKNLFGMGKSKGWALMANATDPTLIKNRITSWLGDRMGFFWSPQMVPVDVVMIGDKSGRLDLGSYCLSELVDIEESRLAIGDTGGYLLSRYNLYQDADEPEDNVFSLDSGIMVTHEDPSFKNGLTDGERAQRDDIQSYLRRIDDLIMRPETIDEENHNELASLFDLKTAADYWLMQEISVNVDAFQTSSTYLHKAGNGLLTLGPLWDFDLAWGDPLSDIWYGSTTTGFNNTNTTWMDALRSKDPLFVELLKQEWNKMKPILEEMIAEGGIIDRYQREVSASRQADYERWTGIESAQRVDDYGKLISNLKKWISLRIAWVDGNLEDLPKSIVKISFEADGEIVETKYVRKGTYLDYGPDPPQKEGYVFVGWFEKNSRDQVKYYRAEQDTSFVADYLEEEKAVAPESLYFSDDEVWVLLGDDNDMAYQSFVYPENVTDGRIKWTSSNTDIFTVGENGYVHGVRVGSAILTGTLYNGISNSLTVHVYDRSTASRMPDGVRLVPEEMKLADGQMEQVHVRFTPTGTLLKVMMLSIISEDPAVAEVKGYGGNERIFLVRGIKEGKTRLTVTAERDGIVYTASCNVIVENSGQTEQDNSPSQNEPSQDEPPQDETNPAVIPEPEVEKPDTAQKKEQQAVKKAQPITVKAKRPSISASKLKKKKRTIKRTKAFKIKNAKGEITFRKLSGSKKLKINQKTGTITVKKGTKKGTYRIRVKVTAAGNENYEAGSKTVTVKVRVK